ncbi:MAG: 2-oxoacid:acceptor oxidoreductase family protein [Candidatus Dormibacterales bacterium]
MASCLRIRIAGSGGQGVVLAGVILAEAAVMAGLNATQSQVYGPQSRGGASRSDVIIDEAEIAFPRAEALDVLVALTDAARAAYVAELVPGGLLLVDGDPIAPLANTWIEHRLQMAAAAAGTGVRLSTNVVALGALWQLTRLVPFSDLERAVAGRVPESLRPLNLAALAAGVQIAARAEEIHD